MAPVSAPMSMALELAESALALTSPNPRVGCVITDHAGSILGTGHTQMAGGAHAEVMALRDAKSKGNDVGGAIAYVTLEPCSHQGRTGPCCDALIEAGLSKVIASLEDPNPLVAGNGFKRLQQSGIAVEVGDGALQSKELNIGFFSRMVRKRPWVRLKIAMSLDGFTALPDGTSQWITSSAARSDGQHWRSRACAILTGSGTILKDNPRLDVRLANQIRQPILGILDTKCKTPTDCAALAPNRPVLLFVGKSTANSPLPIYKDNTIIVPCELNREKIDLTDVMRSLNQYLVNELHVEAGARINAALLESGLVDEILLYIAPKILGKGLPFAELSAAKDLGAQNQWVYCDTKNIGSDIRTILRSTNSLSF